MAAEIVDENAEPEVPELSPHEAVAQLNVAVHRAMAVMWSPDARAELRTAYRAVERALTGQTAP